MSREVIGLILLFIFPVTLIVVMILLYFALVFIRDWKEAVIKIVIIITMITGALLAFT